MLDLETLPDLWARTQAGDTVARDTLVEGYMWLATRLARDKKVPDHIERDDLVSWAAGGLFDAVTKFDPRMSDGQFHKHFLSYASLRVRGAILDGLKSPSVSWASRMTWRRLKEQHAAEEDLAQKFGRPATLTEVAAHLGLKASDLEVFQQMIPIGATAHDDDEHDNGLDGVAGGDFTDQSGDLGAMAMRLAAAISQLPPLERHVMDQLYFRNQNLTQTARLLKLATPRVREIRDSGLVRLRGVLQHI
jgi:RNA polymerase sigma factor for flagellar operon FliA